MCIILALYVRDHLMSVYPNLFSSLPTLDDHCLGLIRPSGLHNDDITLLLLHYLLESFIKKEMPLSNSLTASRNYTNRKARKCQCHPLPSWLNVIILLVSLCEESKSGWAWRHTLNPCTWEAEASGSLWGEANWVFYIVSSRITRATQRPCLKININR